MERNIVCDIVRPASAVIYVRRATKQSHCLYGNEHSQWRHMYLWIVATRGQTLTTLFISVLVTPKNFQTILECVWGTWRRTWLRLQAGKSKVWFLMGLLEFFKRLNPSDFRVFSGESWFFFLHKRTPVGQRRSVCRADNLVTFMSRLSGNPRSFRLLRT
jgi:hypothetical protein